MKQQFLVSDYYRTYDVAEPFRVIDPNQRLQVCADVTIFPQAVDTAVGVFGYFRTLTAEFPQQIPAGAIGYTSTPALVVKIVNP